MKKSLAIFALCLALAVSANAQESAQSVQTSGSAELRRASEVMITPGARNIPIRLPGTVSKGDVISIQYELGGNTVSDSFLVTGINVENGSCSIESKHDATTGKALTDMIHARPCKKIR